MIEEQITEAVSQAELMERIIFLVHEDARLVQIGCTRVGDDARSTQFRQEEEALQCPLMYPRQIRAGEQTENLLVRLHLENELKDLFGIKVKGWRWISAAASTSGRSRPLRKGSASQVIKHKARRHNGRGQSLRWPAAPPPSGAGASGTCTGDETVVEALPSIGFVHRVGDAGLQA
jgi:GTP cyclohydrolase II